MSFVEQLLQTLLPTLLDAARFALRLQPVIIALDDKIEASNIFSTALSDADITVQSAVEVAMLARFPEVPFFGEEHARSTNTKYLIGTSFVNSCEYLVTLDPIDGTRFYLDGQALYQIVLTVVSRDRIEGAVAVFPAYGDYVYAVRGKGAFRGTFDDPFSQALPWRVRGDQRQLFLSIEFARFLEEVRTRYPETYCTADYQKTQMIPYMAACVRGDVHGALQFTGQIIS